MTQSSPSSTARVSVPPASEPAFGSVNPKAPNDSPVQMGVRYFSFCSSVPNKFKGAPPSEIWAEYVIPVEAQARLNSSVTIAKLVVSAPAPPYFSSNGKPIIPMSDSCLKISVGNALERSRSMAPGATTLSANSLMVFLIICCSCVKSKSICVHPLCHEYAYNFHYIGKIKTNSSFNRKLTRLHHKKAAFRKNRKRLELYSYSRKSFKRLLRDGWRNLRRAFASIWRIRSRVTPNTLPTSSRVRVRPSSKPKRRRKTFSSRSVNVSKTSSNCSFNNS